ncbi:hypothetical protein C6B36_03105 [Helicobacter cinaedi]|nr:hypothetical protein C6B36_03105 [Helicobacter cinaedi]
MALSTKSIKARLPEEMSRKRFVLQYCQIMMILNFSLRVIFCRLADVFGIAKEELKKMLDILAPPPFFLK